MKCPFCQQELERNDLDVQLFGCENQNCKHSTYYDAVGTKELWQELIRVHKALDVAKERLNNTVLDAEVFATSEYLASRAKETLDEITALEQKEVK